MALLASQCCSRVLLSRLLTRASLVSQISERRVTVRSQQFPEYSLLFDFDRIKGASRFNRTKLQATYAYAFGLPTLFAGQSLLGVVSTNFVGSFAFFGAFITVFLHSVGFLFNNTIGYIYIKDDGKSVKISYVSYWGRRVDIDTTIDEIYAFSDLPTSRIPNHLYQKVCLMNSKETFKLYLTAGRVLDHKIFNNLFVKVYT